MIIRFFYFGCLFRENCGRRGFPIACFLKRQPQHHTPQKRTKNVKNNNKLLFTKTSYLFFYSLTYFYISFDIANS